MRRYKPDGCPHKGQRVGDHSRLEPDGTRIWTCSTCGAGGKWSKRWMFYGMPECRSCWAAVIERVMCPNCARGHEERARQANG